MVSKCSKRMLFREFWYTAQ